MSEVPLHGGAYMWRHGRNTGVLVFVLIQVSLCKCGSRVECRGSPSRAWGPLASLSREIFFFFITLKPKVE